MPQLELWGDPVGDAISLTYQINPLRPDRPGRFLVIVTRNRDTVIEAGGWDVPALVLHECVDDLMSQAWEGYLFGERGDATAACFSRLRLWRREALDRSRGRV